MRRHRHRLSKDVDIFIDDPQFLGYLTPRLSPVAEALTTDYAEDANYVKLRFPEGEVDFVVSAPLTLAEFTARDIFDFAMVAEREADVLPWTEAATAPITAYRIFFWPPGNRQHRAEGARVGLPGLFSRLL